MKMLLVLSIVITLSITAPAATRTWTGGGTDNNWTTAANWGGTAPVAGDDLVFPAGAARKTSVNNYAAGTLFNTLSINENGYSFSGNQVLLGAGLSWNFTGTSPLSALPLKLNASQTFTGAAGTLTLGTLDMNGATLTLSQTSSTATLGFAGSISGAGSIQKTGPGSTSLVTDNGGFTGAMAFTGGSVVVNHSSAMGTTASGTTLTDCMLTLTGTAAMIVAEPILFQGTSGINSNNFPHTLSGALTVNVSSSLMVVQNQVSSGPVTLSGALSGTAGIDFLFNSAVVSGSASNTLAGVLRVDCTSLTLSRTGGAVAAPNGLLIISGFTCTYTQPNQVNGTVTVQSNATLNLNGNSDSIGALDIGNGGQVQTGTGTLTFSGNITATGLCSMTGKFAVSGARTWTINDAPDVLTVSGPIDGAGSMQKNGPGTLVLNGSVSTLPTIQLNAGTTLMNGVASTAFILNGGTLGGTGAFGNVTSAAGGGVIAPSTGPQFFAGSLALNAATTVQLDIAGTTAMTQYDQINCDGSQDLNGAALQLNIVPGTVLPVGTVLRILNDSEDFPGNITGTFAGKPENSTFTVGAHTFRINYNTGNVDDVELTVTALVPTGIVKTWSGAGANALWSSGANWSGGIAPVQGDALLFPAGAAQLSNTNDLAAGTFFNTLTLNTACSLSGNAITTTSITSDAGASASASIGFAVTLAGAPSLTATSGNLFLADVNASSGTLTITTAFDTMVDILGVLSGSSAILKNSAGLLALAGANTFTGDLTVNAGNLSLSNNSALGSITGMTHLLSGSLSLNSGLTIAENFEISTNCSVTSGNTTLTGSITTTGPTAGDTVVFTVGGGSTLVFSGSLSGPRGLKLTGAGSVLINGSTANTFSDKLDVDIATLTLAKTAGTNAIPAGTLLLMENSRNVVLAASDQIAGNVQLTGGATLNLNGNNETLSVLDMEGGTTVNTGTGTLTIAGTLHAHNAASTINGKLTFSGICTLTVDDSGSPDDLTINAVISDASLPSLTRNGAGRLVLTAANTFTTMRIDAGDTAINGTNSALALTMNSGKLSGTGSVASITSAAGGGIIAPGASAGLFNAGSLNLNAATTVQLDLNGLTAGSGHDQLVTSTTTNTLGGATLQFTLGFSPVLGNSFKLINNTSTTGGTSGTFAGLPEGAAFVFGPYVFRINYNAGTNNNDTLLTYITQPAPTLSSSTITEGPGFGIKTVQMSGTCAFGATALFQESFDLVNWSSVTGVTADATGHWSFNLARPAAVPQMFFRVLIP